MEACADAAQKLFPDALSGALDYMFKSSRNLIEAAVRWGTRCISKPTFLRRLLVSILTGVIIPAMTWPAKHFNKSSTTRYLCVPMVGQGNALGVLHLEFEIAAESGAILSRRVIASLVGNWQ
jgi:hypothetical protein